MEDVFYDLFHENPRELEFEDFLADLQEVVDQQVDLFSRLIDPNNDEFDNLKEDGVNRFDTKQSVPLILQLTEQMEDDICMKFGFAGFNDEETEQAWDLLLDFIKQSCKSMVA